MDAKVSDDTEIPVDVLQSGLKKVRNRRWLLWLVVLVYIPGLFLTMSAGLGSGAMSKLFFVWVGLLCVVVGLATVVKCPRCNKTFHTNGPTFLPVRKCVHCGLAVNADKSKKQEI